MKPNVAVAVPCSDNKSYALHQALRSLRQLELDGTIRFWFPVDALRSTVPTALIHAFGHRYPKYEVKVLPVSLGNRDTDRGDENNWKTRAHIAAMLRQAALMKARDTEEVTHLFFAGCDMLFPPDTLTKLLALDAHLATACYAARQSKYVITLSYDRETKKWAPLPWREETYEVDWCGSDALLVRRDVFERVDWSGFSTDTYRAGEDAWICHRTREEFGAKVWVEGTVLVPHINPSGAVVYPRLWYQDVIRVFCPNCGLERVIVREYRDRKEKCRECGMEHVVLPFWDDVDVVLGSAVRPTTTKVY